MQMIKIIKKKIPIWIKEPIKVYLDDRKVNMSKIAWSHAYCNYIENRGIEGRKKEKSYKKLHDNVYKYLTSKYLWVLDNNYYENNIRSKCIWIFWWQGFETAPLIIKKCIDSVKKNAGTFKVEIIDKNSYMKYVKLSDSILKKLNNGTITITHFSDILRMNLIADYGGYWLDATIFCTDNIESHIADLPIYTGRNSGKDITNISNWNWTGYAIYGNSGNPLFCYVRDLFNAYWENEEHLVDYYLIDYMIKVVYENNDIVKKMIDQIPINNINQTKLDKCFNEEYSDELYGKLINDSDTWLYKITWKKKYNLFTENGKPTIYNHWLNLEI